MSEPTARERFKEISSDERHAFHHDEKIQFLVSLVEAAKEVAEMDDTNYNGFWNGIDQRLSANDLPQVRVDTAEERNKEINVKKP